MTREIPLTQGCVALVDDDDYERFAKFKWYVARTGRGDHPYAARKPLTCENRPDRLIYLHREVMAAAPGEQVDHKRREDTLDCRKDNLRIATHQQNMANRRNKGNGTGFRGVSKTPAGTYAATVGKTSAGSYLTPEEAAVAYDKAALRAYREFAVLNFHDSAARPDPVRTKPGELLRGKPGVKSRAQVTPQQVAEIKLLLAVGVPQKEIAAQYPIKVSAISHIRTGRTWK